VCVCVILLDNRCRVIRADGAAATYIQMHIAHCTYYYYYYYYIYDIRVMVQ